MWFKKRKNQGWVGISYTDMHICVVALKHKQGGKPEVTLAKVEQLSTQTEPALKQLVKQLDLKSSACNVVLGVDQYQILQVDKPNMPDAEVKAALRWKVKDLLDYPVDDAEVDGVSIPADPANPNRLPFMYALCTKRSQLANISNRFIDAGFQVKCVDANVMAQRNVAALLETEDRALAMISFMPRGCLLTFTAKGELYHTRLIELDREFMIDQGGIFTANLDKLALELQRSLDGFDRQFPFLTVKRLVVAPFANRDALIQHLSSQLYLPVETFNVADIVTLPANLDLSTAEKQAMLLPALGGALRVEEAA